MMPAILVTTILGIIRSLEAFEIELLLGTPIGLQVYSTKIHELVTWEPPQFAPAMAFEHDLFVLFASHGGHAAWLYRQTSIHDDYRPWFQHASHAARPVALPAIRPDSNFCAGDHGHSDDSFGNGHVYEAVRIFQHRGSVDVR